MVVGAVGSPAFGGAELPVRRIRETGSPRPSPGASSPEAVRGVGARDAVARCRVDPGAARSLYAIGAGSRPSTSRSAGAEAAGPGLAQGTASAGSGGPFALPLRSPTLFMLGSYGAQ